MRDQKISFIILTWNSEKYISKCLESIYDSKWSDYEIIVIDNGSADRTRDILKKYESADSRIKTILLPKNTGTTYSRNLGLAEISDESDFICILDSDAFINRNAIRAMIDALNADQRNAVCGPYMENLEGVPQVTAKKIPTALLKFCKACPINAVQQAGVNMERYSFPDKNAIYPVGYLISACWMIKRSAYEEIGLLDEKIFYAPEDVEYCVRAWTKNYRVVFVPEAEIVHAVQRISKKKLLSRHNFEHIKGLIYFFSKYHLFISAKHIHCD